MRAAIRRPLAVVLAIFLVTSVSVVFFTYDERTSPIGTARATVNGTFDDFESGDLTSTPTGWTDWRIPQGTASATSSNQLYGNYSLKANADGTTTEVNTTLSDSSAKKKPSRIAVVMNVSGDFGSSDDESDFIVENDGSTAMDVHLKDDGTIWTGFGVTNTGKMFTTNTNIAFEFTNISYANNEYDLKRNGKRIAKDVAFENNVDGIDKIRVRRSSSAGHLYVDEIELNGSEFSAIEWSSGTVEDFESGDLVSTADGWGHWHGAGDLSADGTITVSGSTTSDEYVSPTRQLNTSEISIDVESDSDGGGNDAAVGVGINNETNVGPSMFSAHLNDGSGNITLNAHDPTDANAVDTGFSWSTNTTYTLKFTNIDWSANTYDFEVDGTSVQTGVSFVNNGDGFQEIHLRVDRNTLSSKTGTYDNIKTDTCSNNCDFGLLGGSSGGTNVSGTVVNQNGQPINNATVWVLGVDYDQLTPSASETKDQLGNEELTKAINKTPEEWEEQREDNFQLTGPSGHFEETDETYVAVHDRSDWSQDRFGEQLRDPPELTDPILSTSLKEGETKTVALSIWDVREEQSNVLENDVDQQLPGKPTTGKVTIETLFATDTAFETTTARVRFDEGGALGNLPGVNLRGTPEEYNNAFLLVDLTPGFYKVYPESNPDSAYVIQVGDPIEIFSERVENSRGDVSEQASEVADKVTGGTFEKKTTTTDSDGNWSVSVSSSVNKVEVQAYKAPDVAVNDSTMDFQDILDKYEDANEDDLDDLGSIYLPSETKRVSPPESDVEIELTEVSYPPYSNTTKLSDKLSADQLRQLIESLASALGVTLQPLDDMSRSELEDLYEDLSSLAQQNDQVEERANENLQDNTNDETQQVIVKVENATDQELKDRIESLTQALNELEDTVESEPPTSTTGQETVSVSFPFSEELEEENVVVLAHWSNGTTERLGTSSEYVSIEDRIGQGDVVQITDYPLGEDDSNAVNFEVLVSTPAGVGSASESVVNPAFSNDVPEIKAISLTTLKPGTGEKVDIEVDPEDSSEFGSIEAATVTAPDGSDVATDAIGSDGLSTGFVVGDTGSYHVKLKFNNSDGDSFTEAFRIDATDTDHVRSASVRPQSGVTGVYALVGDGLDSGEVETNADESQVTMSAQIGADQDVPGTVHYYADDIGASSDTTYTLRVVRSDSERSINRQVGVVLHSPKMTSDTPVIYRQSEAPIPRNGSNRNGKVRNQANGTTIQSFTESDGSVRIRVNNDPGAIDRGLYRARLIFEGAPVVGSGVLLPPIDPFRLWPGVAA